MAFENILAGIAVADMEAAKAWYTAFFDRQPDRIPMAADVEWDFPGGSTVQVFEDADRAGSSSATLVPDNLEAELARLAELGHQPSERSSGKFQIAIFEDLDGNRLVLAKPA
ncbi:VOC family protein [Pararhizobium qamdonense]|uniref:VOC family protein n=1 Tax=Pararhizobium qamdonense TaxID=3031126 RepID=UPI0023E24000|nr:VOC family protein [Pararhizobium qamdonense]